ncbi:hypothetical protein Catovirus_2_194 [Catovirus CTV1]|uniref:Uncharacterized protein n=1 Tax=Catovirus CTV1 TaxID=1977631 RepID=A0A1V0SC06_9VIRU|nr:hypothetical protein Catovirus_2_194 [Catovirus CTV1]
MNNEEDLFIQLQNTDGSRLFFYCVIFLIVFAIFQNFTIGLNIILAIFISVIIVLYLNSKNVYDNNKLKNIYKNKTELIRPTPAKIQNYPKFTNFVFSIQDMYPYNPPSYEDMVDAIDNILELYEEAKIDPTISGLNYNLIDQQRKEAVNSLHTIIFNLPSNNVYINKLNESIDVLNNLINELMNEVFYLNKLDIFNNGYDRETIILDKGPKAENFYTNDPFTFDIF